MPAINTACRPIRPAPPPARPGADHFALLGVQAEIMAEARSGRAFDPAQLRTLADLCRAKAARMRSAPADGRA